MILITGCTQISAYSLEKGSFMKIISSVRYSLAIAAFISSTIAISAEATIKARSGRGANAAIARDKNAINPRNGIAGKGGENDHRGAVERAKTEPKGSKLAQPISDAAKLKGAVLKNGVRNSNIAR